MEFIKKIIARLLGYKESGLLPLSPDKRDLEIGSIFDFFGGYTPKDKVKEIKTISIKDQKRLSNCTFQSATVQKEVDEGVILSARYLTAKAYQLGLCKWQGYADMRVSQVILQKYGCCEEKDCPSNSNLSFGEYVKVDFARLDRLASEHKSKSFWKVNNINEYLKAIDEGHIVTLGIPWYSGFNQRGGFRSPWIIKALKGYYVGGHAITGKGYKNSERLNITQNSYSGAWGDGGDLYIDYKFLDKYIRDYGAFANLDIEYIKELTTEDIIEKYQLQNVRGNIKGAIYLIYHGKKYAYKNARAFIARNAKPYSYKDMFIIVKQEVIDKVPNGGLLTEDMGQYKELVANLKDPINDNFKKDGK